MRFKLFCCLSEVEVANLYFFELCKSAAGAVSRAAVVSQDTRSRLLEMSVDNEVQIVCALSPRISFLSLLMPSPQLPLTPLQHVPQARLPKGSHPCVCVCVVGDGGIA